MIKVITQKYRGLGKDHGIETTLKILFLGIPIYVREIRHEGYKD
jgi:hypothetical protein